MCNGNYRLTVCSNNFPPDQIGENSSRDINHNLFITSCSCKIDTFKNNFELSWCWASPYSFRLCECELHVYEVSSFLPGISRSRFSFGSLEDSFRRKGAMLFFLSVINWYLVFFVIGKLELKRLLSELRWLQRRNGNKLNLHNIIAFVVVSV